MQQEGWSIGLFERPLDFGEWDNALLGRDAGHSYLALMDEEGRVVSAMEGNAFTPSNGHLAKGEQSLAGYLSAGARELGLSKIFNKAAGLFGYDLEVPRLRVTMEDHDAFARAHTTAQTIITGGEADMRARWVSAARAAADINRADLMYQGVGFNDYGVNCHSVSTAMMEAMGIPQDRWPGFIYAAPGATNNNLHETVPGLFSHRPEHYAHLGIEELKAEQNEAQFALERSMVSPDLKDRMIARDEAERARQTDWAKGYGTPAPGALPT